MPNWNNSFWYDLLPPLVRGICQIKTYLCSFFSNEGSFSHLFDSLDSRIESNFIGLCSAVRVTFVLKNESCSFSDDLDNRNDLDNRDDKITEIRSIMSLFITCDQVIGLLNHVTRSPR